MLGKEELGPADLPFPVLVDPVFTASATYGTAFGSYGREWTDWPGAFVLDRDGVIRFAYRAGRMSGNYADTDQLLQVVDGLGEKRKLIAALRDKDPRLYRAAAPALKAIGPEARGAVPALLGALKDDNADVRVGAAAALCWIVPPARTALPLFRQALSDKDERVRRLAVEALGEIGPDASPVVPAIVRVLYDADAR